MTLALYATIWSALILFAGAEAGKGRFANGGRPASWAWPAWTVGALLAGIHVLLALAIRYGWNHEAAVSGTARQAAEVYGFEWRGSIYVSYAFILLWLLEALRWKLRPNLPAARSSAVTWTLRAFFLLVIVNGAIIFAHNVTRPLGILIVAVLIWTWMPARTRSPQASTRLGMP